jgi:hypothetical protein
LRVKSSTSRGGGDSLGDTTLHLVDEIFVRLLCEATTFIHIEVDVVEVEAHLLGSGEESSLG